MYMLVMAGVFIFVFVLVSLLQRRKQALSSSMSLEAGKDTLSLSSTSDNKRSDSDTTDVSGTTADRPATQDDTPRFLTQSEGAPQCTELSPDEVTFTLVTQLSEDRLWMMEHHCQRWGEDRPISIAVHTNQTLLSVQDKLIEMGCSLDHVQAQVYSTHSIDDYPVNILRNMALSMVKTTHVAYVDVDFWPSIDFYDTLTTDTVRLTLAYDYKTALIVPAFSLRRQCQDWRDCPENNIPVMPTTRIDLLRSIFNHEVSQFDPSNRGGHGSTRYKEWLSQNNETVEMIPIECVKSRRYEPYLVFRYCHDLPPFQPSFTGYGKNKMTWILQLLRSGWTLQQVSHAFVVHYPHLDSPSRFVWNGGDNGRMLNRPQDNLLRYKRGQVDQLYKEFRKWMEATIPDDTKVPLCPSAGDDDSRLWVDKRR
jgi:Glycosyl-transferase for dystroglycan